MRRITRKHFIERVGREPTKASQTNFDELEMTNCRKAGIHNHSKCGWCAKCDLPVTQCGHDQIIITQVRRAVLRLKDDEF